MAEHTRRLEFWEEELAEYIDDEYEPLHEKVLADPYGYLHAVIVHAVYSDDEPKYVIRAFEDAYATVLEVQEEQEDRQDDLAYSDGGPQVQQRRAEQGELEGVTLEAGDWRKGLSCTLVLDLAVARRLCSSLAVAMRERPAPERLMVEEDP